MSDLLSGLEAFGIKEVSGENMFQEKSKKPAPQPKAKPTVVYQEKDVLFDKTYTCPVCDGEFKTKTVKSGRTRVKKTDTDLRPIYEGVDALKYDVVMCPICGYSALTRYYKGLTALQKKAIKENISRNYHMQDTADEVEMFTYDDAIARHKLALANSIVKGAPASEKAFVCLKTAWLFRGKKEELEAEGLLSEEERESLEQEESDFLKNAYEGFIAARKNELPPLCGMDEPTLDYVLAVCAAKFEQFDVATKMISNILLSPMSNSRIKDKTRDLKDEIIAKIKGKS